MQAARRSKLLVMSFGRGLTNLDYAYIAAELGKRRAHHPRGASTISGFTLVSWARNHSRS